MQTVGKLLIVFGLIMVCLGALLCLRHNIPFIGRLPLDIKYERPNLILYFPFGTSIIISIIATLVLYAIMRVLR